MAKKYQPSPRYNPIVMSKQIEKHRKDLEKLGQNIEAISKSNDSHISLLGNFARHDIKNCIQSMDSILSTNSADEITEEHLDALKANLKVIRETMDNFSKLVPYSKDEKFTAHNLLIALGLLNRDTFYTRGIDFIRNYDKNKDIYLKLPFHGVLQMVNNLIINAINSLDNIDIPIIEIQVETDNSTINITILDNGEIIQEDFYDKIFEFGFTTTGGSGIGLFHARFFCETYNGVINLISKPKTPYTKGFIITLPVEV